MSTGKFFTGAEDRYILEHAGKLTWADIAGNIGRSRRGVQKRAARLGYVSRPCKRWTSEEDAALLSARGIRLAEMAATLGRGVSECGERAKFLGIQSWAKHSNGGKYRNDRNGYEVSRVVRAGERKHRRVNTHREVVERALGRPLSTGEVVHHINGDKLDNRAENLFVCKDAAAHRRAHHSYTKLLAGLVSGRAIYFDSTDGVYKVCTTNN